MTWEPPADPDLERLARFGWESWELDKPTTIAFDTETSGLEFHDRAFCATIAWRSPREDILTGQPIGVEGHYFETERFDSSEAIRRIFEHAEVIVAHNLKFDLHRAEAAGWFTPDDWRGKQFHDTEAMAHLTDEHRPKGLKALAVEVLGFDDTIQVPAKRKNKDTGEQESYFKDVPKSKYEIDQARAWAKKHYGLDSIKDVGYEMLPRGTLVPYAILDAEWTLELANRLFPQVMQFPDLYELYQREMALTTSAIYSLEKAGMATRPDYVKAEILAYRKKVIQHELDIEGMVGKQVRSGKIPPKERADYFNPASNDEVGAYFAALGEVHESYDAEHLALIKHPLASKLLDYRSDKKILDGYFVSLQRDTGADGVFHPSLRQHGTVTGRTSAGAERGDS